MQVKRRGMVGLTPGYDGLGCCWQGKRWGRKYQDTSDEEVEHPQAHSASSEHVKARNLAHRTRDTDANSLWLCSSSHASYSMGHMYLCRA
jgi:hypothetical protein